MRNWKYNFLLASNEPSRWQARLSTTARTNSWQNKLLTTAFTADPNSNNWQYALLKTAQRDPSSWQAILLALASTPPESWHAKLLNTASTDPESWQAKLLNNSHNKLSHDYKSGLMTEMTNDPSLYTLCDTISKNTTPVTCQDYTMKLQGFAFRKTTGKQGQPKKRYTNLKVIGLYGTGKNDAIGMLAEKDTNGNESVAVFDLNSKAKNKQKLKDNKLTEDHNRKPLTAHGTSNTSACNILLHGLDEEKSKRKLYGEGFYAANMGLSPLESTESEGLIHKHQTHVENYISAEATTLFYAKQKTKGGTKDIPTCIIASSPSILNPTKDNPNHTVENNNRYTVSPRNRALKPVWILIYPQTRHGRGHVIALA